MEKFKYSKHQPRIPFVKVPFLKNFSIKRTRISTLLQNSLASSRSPPNPAPQLLLFQNSSVKFNEEEVSCINASMKPRLKETLPHITQRLSQKGLLDKKISKKNTILITEPDEIISPKDELHKQPKNDAVVSYSSEDDFVDSEMRTSLHEPVNNEYSLESGFIKDADLRESILKYSFAQKKPKISHAREFKGKIVNEKALPQLSGGKKRIERFFDQKIHSKKPKV